jgi:hypothetical protein
MTWLAVITISLALAIFLVRRKSKEKPNQIEERDMGRSYEAGHRFAQGRGDDMKKWKDADYGG